MELNAHAKPHFLRYLLCLRKWLKEEEDPGAESGTESEMIGRLPNSWGTGTIGDLGEDALGVGHRQTWRTQATYCRRSHSRSRAGGWPDWWSPLGGWPRSWASMQDLSEGQHWRWNPSGGWAGGWYQRLNPSGGRAGESGGWSADPETRGWRSEQEKKWQGCRTWDWWQGSRTVDRNARETVRLL